MCNLVVMHCCLGMAILNLPVLQSWLPYFNLEVMIGILKKRRMSLSSLIVHVHSYNNAMNGR
jgi:hypothetical protein